MFMCSPLFDLCVQSNSRSFLAEWTHSCLIYHFWTILLYFPFVYFSFFPISISELSVNMFQKEFTVTL